MKTKHILGILLLSFLFLAVASEVHATVYNEGPNVFYTGGNVSTTTKTGWLISPRVSGSIVNVTLYGTSATAIYLYNEAQSVLYSSGTCTTNLGQNNVCTFSNSSNTVTNLQSYYVLIDNSTNNYRYGYQSTGLSFPYTFTSYYLNGTQNNGGTHPVTNEIADILNITIDTASTNITNTIVLNISVRDVVTNQTINSFCINATGTNTTQNFCVDAGVASFSTTGTYNISTYNIGGITNSTYGSHPQQVVNGTSYDVRGDSTSGTQYCLDRNQSFGSVTTASEFGFLAYWNGTAWAVTELDDFQSHAVTIRCFGRSDAYFNQSIQNFVFTQNTTLTLNTSQGYINVQPYRLFLNNNVNGFNLSNNRTSGSTTSSSMILNASFGNNNYAVSVAGNYTVNMTCNLDTLFSTTICVGPGVYDDLFQLNATDADSGLPVTTFTITATNVTIGASSSNSTTNGTAYVPVIRGYYYTFLIDPSGHAITNVTLPANSSKNNYTFVLLPGNSVFIFFVDEETLATITSNISVTFANDTVSFENSSTSGSMVQTDLTPGVWTLSIGSANGSSDYGIRQYFLDITNQSSQDLTAYLLSDSSSQTTDFTVKDGSTTDIIQGAEVTLQSNVGGNWVTVDQQITDIFGVVQFELIPSKQYRIIVSADGYSTKQGEFYATQTSYTIILDNLNTQDFTTYADDFSYIIGPNNVSRAVTNFSLTVSSPNGSVEWFAIEVIVNGTTTTQNVTSSPGGGTAQIVLNLSPYSNTQVYAFYYIKGVSFTEPLTISRNWYLSGYTPGNYTLDDFMTHYKDDNNGLSVVSRGILVTVGAVILGALLGFIFGGAAAVIGASAVFIIGAWYLWIHPTITFIVVAGLLGAIFLNGRGR